MLKPDWYRNCLEARSLLLYSILPDWFWACLYHLSSVTTSRGCIIHVLKKLYFMMLCHLGALLARERRPMQDKLIPLESIWLCYEIAFHMRTNQSGACTSQLSPLWSSQFEPLSSCPNISSRTGTRQLGEVSTARSLLTLFELANSNLFICSALPFPTEIPIKTCTHAFFPLLLPPDLPYCIPTWPPWQSRRHWKGWHCVFSI